MIDLILLAIFGYSLYRLTIKYNISPYRWVIMYVVSFISTVIGVSLVLISFYGESIMKDLPHLQRISLWLEPFIMLYQVVLYFFLRNRMLKYVQILDRIEDHNNRQKPGGPDPQDQKDLSYFR